MPSQEVLQPGLDRYREITDDWDALAAACSRPLPLCGWTHPLRPDSFRAMDRDGLEATDLAWRPGGFRIVKAPSMASSLSYRAGLFHIQEEASMLPVALLAPVAGERVLDLCAAPGNKTAEIAARMGGSGTVVANDPAKGRLNVLRTTLDRLGLVNVSVTTLDGRSLDFPADHFDAVLVDAPCSCEGTLRKHPGIIARTRGSERERLVKKQKALLRNALRIVRPGGRVVYSTCSFAPEENEMVIESVLAERTDVSIETVQIPNLASSPSISEWRGTSISTEGAVRLWPHHVDSGGFFAARLVRSPDVTATDGTEGAAMNPPKIESGRTSGHPPKHLRVRDLPEPTRVVVEFIIDHFGLDEAFLVPAIRFVHLENVLNIRAQDHDPGFEARFIASGISLTRLTGRVPKLTTQGALFLGLAVTRQWVDLGRPEAFAFMRGDTVKPGSANAAHYGYVQVRCVGTPIGVGLFDPKTGLLESKYPRSWGGLSQPR